jgi:hypothetical protein
METAVRGSRDSTVSAPRGRQVGNRFVPQDELDRWKSAGWTVEHELRDQAYEKFWNSFEALGMSKQAATFWAADRARDELKRRYPDEAELTKNWDRYYSGLVAKYAAQLHDMLRRARALQQ